jgi:hypothetical protein
MKAMAKSILGPTTIHICDLFLRQQNFEITGFMQPVKTSL